LVAFHKSKPEAKTGSCRDGLRCRTLLRSVRYALRRVHRFRAGRDPQLNRSRLEPRNPASSSCRGENVEIVQETRRSLVCKSGDSPEIRLIDFDFPQT